MAAGAGSLKQTNEKIRMMTGAQQARAAQNQLWGGANLKQLFPGQSPFANRAQLNKKSIDPILAIQLYQKMLKSKGKKINSATSCAAAIHAARLAGSPRYGHFVTRPRKQGLAALSL